MRSDAWLTLVSVASLILGFGLGTFAFEAQITPLLMLREVAQPLGQVWVNGLTMIVIPLVVSLLTLAVASAKGSSSGERIASVAFGIFLLMLLIGALFTILFVPPFLEGVQLDSETDAAIRGVAEFGGLSSFEQEPLSPWGILIGFVPVNIVQAAVDGNFVALIGASLLFGFALRRVSDGRRGQALAVLRSMVDASLVIVGWLLKVLPLGVFCLAYSASSASGQSLSGAFARYVLLATLLCLIALAAFYPVTCLLGRIPFLRWAKILVPVQASACATRSSLATLPSMFSASDRLGISTEVSGVTLPLTVSSFKMNMALTSVLKVLFLVKLHSLELSPGMWVFLIAGVLLKSLGSPGIPHGSSLVSLPLYIAAGIPPGSYVLVKAADAIPEMFKTALNVTADLSVTAMTAQFLGYRNEVSERDSSLLAGNLPSAAQNRQEV